MMVRNQEITYSNDNIVNSNCVKFVISHTLRQFPQEEDDDDDIGHASGTRILDWKVHLDVVEGDPRPIIARIEADFGPTFLRRREFVWNRPRRIRNASKKKSDDKEGEEITNAWRCFESRQKCRGTPPIVISIVGMGGTVLPVKYFPCSELFEGYFFEKNISMLGATNGLHYLLPIPLPPDRSFSIEQYSNSFVGRNWEYDLDNNMLPSRPKIRTNALWDRGEEGVENIRQSLAITNNQNANDGSSQIVNTVISIQLFEDTPNEKNLENMIKVSQNFIKYEDAIDKIIQINRELRILEDRNAQIDSQSLRSNKCDIEGQTNRAKHNNLASCSKNLSDLVKAMNPRKNQRYKFMFAKEENRQDFTARFFFPALPRDVDFVISLLRFCTLFVHNSFRFQKPKPLKPNRSIEDEMDFLFSYVVRDRFVEEMLLFDEEQSKVDGVNDDISLRNFDIDAIDDDEISIPVSIFNDGVEVNQFRGILDSSHRKRCLSRKEAFIYDDYDVRKRLRSLTSPTSNRPRCHSIVIVNAGSLNVDVVSRSQLSIENKKITASKLAIIGKKLGTGTSNNKLERLKRLQDYFDARVEELKSFRKKDKDRSSSGIMGVEFIFKNITNRDDNNIYVILRGRRQITMPRRSVCESKCDKDISSLPIGEEDAKTIFKMLYGKEGNEGTVDYNVRIDDFIDQLQKQESNENNSCQFALVHDLFLEP